MAQQTIDVGSANNVGGETLRSGSVKILANFTELRSKTLVVPPNGFTVYVSPSGNDSNDGLTPYTPVLTLAKAGQIIHNSYYLPYGTDAIIQLADGTYSGQSEMIGVCGDGMVIIRGNIGSPTSVVVTSVANTLLFATPARYRLEGFDLRCTAGTGTAALLVRQKAYVEIGEAMTFGACGASTDQIMATDRGLVVVKPGITYYIRGGCRYHYSSLYGGIITANGITCTVQVSSLSMTRFAYAVLNSVVESLGSTYNNRSFIGTSSFNADGAENSVFNVTGGTTANYFPGNGGASVSGTDGSYIY